MTLDRDRDLRREVPAAREDAADQGVVDPELVAFFAEAFFRGIGGGVEVGARARMEAHDHEAADVVKEGGDGELVAVGPADRATDLLGGVLGREGVDPEALRAQVAGPVLLEEVEDLGGARDRQHPGGLEDVDGGGNVATPCARPVRLAARSTDTQRATSASTASTTSPTRTVSAVAAFITRAWDSTRTGKRSTDSNAAARRAPGARFSAPLRPAPAFALLSFSVLVVGMRDQPHNHRHGWPFGLAADGQTQV